MTETTMTNSPTPLPWFDLSSAPRDGTSIWGRVDQDARRMLWHAGFGAFVASWRRMTLADGMTFDDTGLSHKDHSPEIVNADAWMPMPGTEIRVPPPGQAALVETLREAVADALRPFAWVADRMISGPQFVRGYPDTKPDDTDECEILSIGDGDGGNQSLLRRDFMSARAALIALQGRT